MPPLVHFTALLSGAGRLLIDRVARATRPVCLVDVFGLGLADTTRGLIPKGRELCNRQASG